ncbi:MAG: hypothetical protein ACKV2O_16610 [Acidimicrobiales bacterium]
MTGPNPNGRVTPRGRRDRSADDELPSFRRRSPLAYWVALLILAGLLATLFGGVVASVAR